MNMTKIHRTITASKVAPFGGVNKDVAVECEPVVSKIDCVPQPFTAPKVAAYARVSSGKDAMLHSLAAQVSYYSDYIQKREEWNFAGIYADEAFTGTKLQRPEFQRMLRDCKAGLIDLIIVKSISRFSRNTVDFLQVIRELKDIGVNVYFEEQNIYTMSGDGELLLTLMASFAQAESQSVSENCKWRIRKRFAAGELVCWNFMYGYHIDKEAIEIVEEQADVVRMVFDDYISGMGFQVIVKKLNDMEIPSLRGNPWGYTTIEQMLKNEKYAGNAILQKTYISDDIAKKCIRNKNDLAMHLIENSHPAIIERDKFDRVQTLMEQRRVRVKSKDVSHIRYPFSGVVKCGICGKSYIRKVCQGRTYWHCYTYLHSGKKVCPSKRVPDSVLYDLSADILGLSEFDEAVFKNCIMQIDVPAHNTLVFLFFNGDKVERTWQDRSRAESWNDEMRDQARQRAKRRFEA